MARIRQLTCVCGARIVANDVLQTLRHEGDECEQFRAIVARNASGHPYVADPQTVAPSTEEAEIDQILTHNDGRDVVAMAREFGIAVSDPREACREFLREMRARGWNIRFPKSTQ
jgi:hypothetical protein